MNEDLKNILLKVHELYTKYGIKSITMDDVATDMGISKKTLYQFVTDKDDLVGKFIDLEIELRQEEIVKCFNTGCNAIEELFENIRSPLRYCPAAQRRSRGQELRLHNPALSQASL